MKEEHAAVAGEMSGHFFFADRFYGYDDAPYAALRLLEILSKSGKTVGELLSDLPKAYFTPEIRFDCPDGIKAKVVESVKRSLQGTGDINEIDGVRVTYEDGAWGLVRPPTPGPSSCSASRHRARNDSPRSALGSKGWSPRPRKPSAARAFELRAAAECAFAVTRRLEPWAPPTPHKNPGR